MGKTVDNIFDFQDKLALIAAFISTGVGLTILTPLGRIISTQNPKWLWFVPLIILVSMTTILIGMYQNAKASRRDHVLLFRCNEWEELGVFKPNAEIAEIGFFALDNLPEGTTPATHRRIGEIYHERGQSLQW